MKEGVMDWYVQLWCSVQQLRNNTLNGVVSSPYYTWHISKSSPFFYVTTIDHKLDYETYKLCFIYSSIIGCWEVG